MAGFVKTLIAFAVALVAAHSVASAEGEFTSGGWQGGARFENGYFSQCSMEMKESSGLAIAIDINRNHQLVLHFDNPSWSLPLASAVGLTIVVDRMAPLIRSGTVEAPTRLATVFTSAEDAIENLGRARRIELSHETGGGAFDLTGIGPALARLRACVASHG